MTSTYISIISHNNDQMIIDNYELTSLTERCRVIVKSNTPASTQLIQHCEKHNITLINSDYGLGFGANNNFVFSYVSEHFDLKENDFFLVMNPDVVITLESMNTLINEAERYASTISTINLYRDKDYSEYDQSIKHFPSILTPLKAKFTKIREDTYNKDMIDTPVCIDWAAGSFLLFKASIYRELDGFDESFFMYFEDVDLAKRAKKKNISLTYFPNIKAVHFASYQNRKIFSKNFLWYINSFLKYHFKQL
ncbi:glycosyltransferase family 2 protein [Photobacterium chitinilyticum]|uniref:glycosyltransferase family 2 protein n=1 Tax=Photobacterium chitinilyticum TaxID=2485123 RepID=UPI003D13E9DB